MDPFRNTIKHINFRHMAYIEDTYDIKSWREHEIRFAGQYGKKGERRGERSKATPEQIARQNQKNREKRLTRVLRANFDEGDLFLTIKYKRGTRPGVEQFVKDFRNFRNRLARAYKKVGVAMKYVYRMEIGRNGGAHIHLVLNRVDGISLADIQDRWEHGRINAQALYREGGFKELAQYILKKPEWTEAQQFSIFLEHGKKMWAFNTSRNLIRPVPQRKVYRRRTLEKMIRDGIKPKDGYRVIPDSVEYGINPFTGTSYLRYTEEALEKGSKGSRQKVPRQEGVT